MPTLHFIYKCYNYHVLTLYALPIITNITDIHYFLNLVIINIYSCQSIKYNSHYKILIFLYQDTIYQLLSSQYYNIIFLLLFYNLHAFLKMKMMLITFLSRQMEMVIFQIRLYYKQNQIIILIQLYLYYYYLLFNHLHNINLFSQRLF